MNGRVLFARAALSVGAPAVAAGQGAGTRISVEAAVGSHINGGGTSQSLSLGVLPGERVCFFVSVTRSHLPTEVTQYDDGYSATRGGTITFISGEVRLLPFTVNRVSPYVLGGAGRGVSRPNVNDLFRDRVTNDVSLLFAGGGFSVPVTEHLRAFADMRFAILGERGEAGVLVPVRGGLSWRF